MAKPGASMLVAGSAAGGEELCLVADGSGVSVRSCLDAIAHGSAEEVFTLTDSSQLLSAATGSCLSIAGEHVVLQDCEQAADAGDGHSIFTLTPSSQLKAKSGYCLSATAAGAAVAPCSAGQGSVTVVAVSEANLAAAAAVKDVAALLLAAEARQQALLQQLESGLDACNGLVQEKRTTLASTRKRQQASAQDQGTGSQIDAAVGVNLAAVKQLIADSQAALHAAQ